MGSRLTALASVLAALCLPPVASGAATHLPYRLDAASSFDPYASETAWLTAHVNLIKGYGSFAREHYVAKGFPVIDYHDFATEGYAPLTPENRTRYMAKVEADKAQGFLGVSNDDVNLNLSFRDGNQNKSAYEPEAKEEAALLAQERAFWPDGIIETNTQWHDLKPLLEKKDPNAAVIVADSDILYKEFGVGPTAGITTLADWEYLLAFNRTHTMVYGGDYHSPLTNAIMEYNLATSMQNPQNYVAGTGTSSLPPTFWPGFEVLTGPYTFFTGPFHIGGYWTEFYEGGTAIVNPPGSSTKTICLTHEAHSVEWGNVTKLTLGAGQGAVLTPAVGVRFLEAC